LKKKIKQLWALNLLGLKPYLHLLKKIKALIVVINYAMKNKKKEFV